MMEENKSQMGMGQNCNCGMCMHKHHHGNFFLRMILGLLILFIVFWLGMQIGEFKGSLESGYGYGNYSGMYGTTMPYRSMRYHEMMQVPDSMGGQSMMPTSPSTQQ